MGRSPDPLNDTNQANALANLGSKLIRVQVARDRQLIATATTTNAPTTISALAILKIYKGEWTTWGDVTCSCATHTGETIIPLLLPTDAGMWNTCLLYTSDAADE